MRILVDTCAVLWWLEGDHRLSRRCRGILEDFAHRRLVSYASLWEIAIKMSARRPTVRNFSFREITAELKNQQFEFLPIRIGDMELLDSLPWHHRDPFDRLLIAQSIAEGIPIMTSDSWVEDYEVNTIR